ncbi:hypothetical protein SAMN05216343_10444 [Oscillibacter sp. PC13]|uniref:hypothetical protein n=1 Tax=Oscillibacter sp. PC13 TaxID=1855299 RepID=UPI0008E86214|nr:hypothetical protein [Oscillibacter sp. PC13]SFP18986.1 hypothetical protein SAMN05216343_10444 [Oscillibacter sp. PC13]
MEKDLNSYLKGNERVCWQGKPMAFPLLENGTKFKILAKWIIAPIAAISLLLAYFHYNDQWSMGFVGLVAIITVLAVISPILERRNVTGCRYWITDQRVILQTRDKSFFYMNLDDIDDYQIVRDVADQDCLVLGSCLFQEIHKQMRWRACHPLTDVENQGSKDQAKGLIFYGIGNAEAAEEFLVKHIKGRAA